LVEKRTAEITAANEKLLKDMDYARNIQSALLPVPSLPKFEKVDFAARYMPCEKIGGDFYNIFRLDEENIGFDWRCCRAWCFCCHDYCFY
jgi:sigma-B regulation protein RsbU (phosphoserine phosphatase)